MNNHDPEPLIQFLAKYSKISFCYIVAIPLSNIEKQQQQLKLANPLNQLIPLTFSYSKERHIELDLDKIVVQRQINPDIYDPIFHDYSYIIKAIEKGQTDLNDNEVLDFIKLVGDSTYAFFKVKRDGSDKDYFIALTADMSYPQTKSGHNKIFNENTTFWDNITIASSLPSFVKDYTVPISPIPFIYLPTILTIFLLRRWA